MDRTGPPMTGLTIDPEGTQLAAGDSDGQLIVWPLPSGDPRYCPMPTGPK